MKSLARWGLGNTSVPWFLTLSLSSPVSFDNPFLLSISDYVPYCSIQGNNSFLVSCPATILFLKHNCSFKWFSFWNVFFLEIDLIIIFPGGSDVKVSAYSVGALSSIPGLGRSPEEGNGNPLQYSCQENPMDGGALWATVHGVTKSQTWLSDFTTLEKMHE